MEANVAVPSCTGLCDTFSIDVDQEVVASSPTGLCNVDEMSIAAQKMTPDSNEQPQEEGVLPKVREDFEENIAYEDFVKDSLQLLSEIARETSSLKNPIGTRDSSSDLLDDFAESSENIVGHILQLGECSNLPPVALTNLPNPNLSTNDGDRHNGESGIKVVVYDSANCDLDKEQTSQHLETEPEEHSAKVGELHSKVHNRVVEDVSFHVENTTDSSINNSGNVLFENDSAIVCQSSEEQSGYEQDLFNSLSQTANQKPENNRKNDLVKYPAALVNCFVKLKDVLAQEKVSVPKRHQQRAKRQQRCEEDKVQTVNDNTTISEAKSIINCGLSLTQTHSSPNKETTITESGTKRRNEDHWSEQEAKKLKTEEINFIQPFRLLMKPSDEFFGALDVIKDQLLELRLQNEQLLEDAKWSKEKKEKHNKEVELLTQNVKSLTDENSKLKKVLSTQANSYARQIIALEKKLAAKAERTANETENLLNKLDKSEKEVKKLKMENDKSRATITRMSQTVQKQSDELALHNEHFENIRKTVRAVVRQDSEVCQNIDTGNDDDLQDSEVEELVISILVDFSVSKKQQVADIQTCLRDIQTLREKNDAYKRNGNKLIKKVKELHNEIESGIEIKNELLERIRQIQSLEKEVKLKDETISRSEKEIVSKDQEIERLKSSQLQQTLSANTKTQMSGQTQFERLKNDLSRKEKELEQLQGQVTKVKSLEIDIIDKKKKIEELEREVGVVQEVRRLVEEKDTKIKKLQTLLLKCQDWAQQLLKKNKLIDELQKQIDRLLDAEKQSVSKEALLNVTAQVRERVGRLQEAENHLVVKDNRIAQLQNEIEQLKKQEMRESKDREMMESKVAKYEELERQLKKKDAIIVDLQLKTIRILELEKMLKRKEKGVEKMIGKGENEDDKSIARVVMLEDQLSLKDKTISELTLKCSKLEEEREKISVASQARPRTKRKNLEESDPVLKELEGRLKQQEELVETLQWSFYTIDEKLTKCKKIKTEPTPLPTTPASSKTRRRK